MVDPRLDKYTLAQVERIYIKDVLLAHKGCVTACAKHAGISRSTFYRKVIMHGLQDFRNLGRKSPFLGGNGENYDG